MAEYIYIAESLQYPGIVKIGRTDRDVQVRMDELSKGDYGLPESNIDSDWEAVKIIEVQDNEAAEALLHNHYDHLRVTDSRELFYSEDPLKLAYEAETIVDGTMITTDLIEIGNLFDPLSIVAICAAITLTAKTFAPDNKNTIKAEKFMRSWELRTEQRYKNANTDVKRFIYGGLNLIFRINKSLGEGAADIIEGFSEGLGYKKVKKLPTKIN